MKYDLTIVIPVYNESQRIPLCMEKLCAYREASGLRFETIFVDNASIDNTAAFIRLFATRHSWVRGIYLAERGKGLAVREGMLLAHGYYCYMADCDLSTPLTELPKFLNSAGDFDIVIGSREVDRKWVKTSLKRRLIGRGFHLLTNWLTPGIRDTQCGFKLFRRPVALDLFSACQINGFAFDLEVLYLARLRGYSVRELPVKWVADPDSRVDLARDPWRMLWDCLSVPLIHHQKIKLPA